ncbi:MAG: carbon-nitrogen hydrolase [Acidimicrobiaceae bacterium]|nr:carbon-nitrogen hydrolase [Acidimicrobiaceae bacterium]|tara:strand:- start:1838 stop:2602 length:765 start_codon:yes stop_codon:yes gene_type:complete
MSLKIAAIQHDIVWEEPDANFERLAPQIQRAAAAGGQLLVLSEMFSTGFTMNSELCAEPLEGPSCEFLLTQATSQHVWVTGSVPTRWEDGIAYNTLILAAPSGDLYRYKKIHPFSFSSEPENYGAGSEFLQVDVEGIKTTFFICYDLRFADEFWQTAHSTDLFVIPANWPERRRTHWQTLLQARAIENQAYVLGVNRVGEGDGLSYAGDSALIDPWGETLAAGASTEALLIAEVDATLVRQTRTTFPVLQDRRN